VTLDVIFVHPGFGSPGGVTVDVRNLETGLTARRHRARTVGTPMQLLRSVAACPDALVHVFGCLPSATTFGALVLARLRGLPLVWTPIFNPIRRHTWAGYGLLRAMAVFDAVAPRAARLAHAVIAATPPEARYFRALGARRVELIPPGVDPPSPAATADELGAFRARVGVGSGPLVLTVGRDNSRKALPFGLAAFAELRRTVPDAQLLLVGPDRGFGGAAQPGVICPGWLDQPAIALAYQAADLLFVPSLYEGLPRAVIEAWRWGTPVVATDRVALASTIDGVGGRVIPYGDTRAAAWTLVELLADPGQRARLGAAGRELVEESFLMPDLVEQTLALYLELAARAS
jgi:glycosyltransferase involved in cell wall biosynthesis